MKDRNLNHVLAPLHDVMREVPLADGSGTVPVQLLWSNKDNAPASGV
jgi:hypothetical protein